MSQVNGAGKVMLITGSSRGIGAALAHFFARRGYHLAINYLKSESQALELRDRLRSEFGPEAAIALGADVADRLSVNRMFSACLERFGRVDVLVNNAGLNLDKPFLEMTESEWRRVIDTILTGSFHCSQEFGRRFSGEEGHIINIGAVTAIHGRKNGANYCSARAGVLTLTRCLALELAPHIRVNCVTPGWIASEEVVERYGLRQPDNFARTVASVPLGRLGTPDDVATMIRFLVEEAGYVTGQNFFVDGGKLMR